MGAVGGKSQVRRCRPFVKPTGGSPDCGKFSRELRRSGGSAREPGPEDLRPPYSSRLLATHARERLVLGVVFEAALIARSLPFLHAAPKSYRIPCTTRWLGVGACTSPSRLGCSLDLERSVRPENRSFPNSTDHFRAQTGYPQTARGLVLGKGACNARAVASFRHCCQPCDCPRVRSTALGTAIACNSLAYSGSRHFCPHPFCNAPEFTRGGAPNGY